MEGQMTIWDFLEKEEPKRNDVQPDDSICEGCKWRETKGRWLEVNDLGHTWVHCCPGTACANWKQGTPLNLTCQDEIAEYMQDGSEGIYCYNRDFLPSLEQCVEYVKDNFGFHFTTYQFEWDDKEINRTIYKCVFKKGSVLELTESTYSGTNKRYIGVSWEGRKAGFGAPCDNLHEVSRFVEQAWERHLKEREALKNYKEEIEP